MKFRLSFKTLSLIILSFFIIPFGFYYFRSFNNEVIAKEFHQIKNSSNASCGLTKAIKNQTAPEIIKGSCCGEMKIDIYKKQIKGLKKYSKIKEIPPNPYNLSSKLAKKLIGYQENIKLNSQEQKTYNKAIELSEEHGPCCCHCYRWLVWEGLAKFLIKNHNFTANQIVNVWNLSDACGS